MLRRTSLERWSRSVLCATALVSASASVYSQTNGSFESPDIVASGSYAPYGPGSTLITGWTVADAGEIQLIPDTFMGLTASDGRQWVDLTGVYGYDKGIYSDPISVTEGAQYHLSLDVGNYLPFGMSTVAVTINGKDAHLITNTSLVATGDSPMNWATFGFDWTAETSFARIEIFGRANGAFSNDGVIGIDNVSLVAADNVSVLTAVPEPETYLLMLAGFGAISFVARRRRLAEVKS